MLLPMRYFHCGFICFMVGAVQSLDILNALILTLCVSNIFTSVTVTELPLVLEGAVNSVYLLIFYCLIRNV